jgi:predicted nucleic acid-binding Zn ribbon protein
LFGGWEQLVGADIAAHCTPLSIRDGVLYLAVDQPAWAAQVRFMAGDLLSALARGTDSDEVREIRVRVRSEDPSSRSRPRRSGTAWSGEDE